MTARAILGRNRGGDLAKQRSNELGISRATWFRRVKNGLIEKPPAPANEAARREAWNNRRQERRAAIFVIPRKSLIEQTVTAFEREGSQDIGVIQARHHRTRTGAAVQIAMAQTLARRAIPQAGLVIIDEAHLQYKSVTEWIAAAEWAAVPFIGLTATPWAKGMGLTYDDLLQPVTISELIGEGFLSKFTIFAPPGPDVSGVKITAGDYNERDLAEAVNTRAIVGDVIATWLEKGHGYPTLVYGVDRAHARHLQERFIEARIVADYIDCDTELPEREEIFQRFREGKTNVICNVATLDTGIDLDVRCIVDARPTKSRIRFVQTIGRGLRPAEGKDALIILDHAGNTARLGLVTDQACDSLDDGTPGAAYDKRAVGKTPEIKLCPECSCVVPPRAPACPQCGHLFPATSDVTESGGKLVEFNSGKRGGQGTAADKILWHGALAWIAAEKGYKPGWVSNQFRTRFGHWPIACYAGPRRPTVEISNWVRSRQIAFAKATRCA
jgi:DNA repair protein RadD